MELLLGVQRLLLLFPLAQDKGSFLGELRRRTASLEGLKMVALPRPCSKGPHVKGQQDLFMISVILSDYFLLLLRR